MKTSIKLFASALFACLLTAFSASPVRAGDDKSQTKAFVVAMFPAADASKLWVCLEKKYQSGDKINLALVNEQGETLFNETVCGKNSKPDAYRQKFDISQLADGKYTFRIVTGNQKKKSSLSSQPPS